MASPWPGKTLTPTASYCRLAAKRDHHIHIKLWMLDDTIPLLILY